MNIRTLSSSLAAAGLVSAIFVGSAFAQPSAPVASSSKAQISGACMVTAVGTRDTAIMGALDKYSASLKTDFQTRLTALQSAWNLTDTKARAVALKTAWSAFNTSSKTDRKTYNTARKAAWTQFKTDSKTCKVPVSNADSVGASVEAGL